MLANSSTFNAIKFANNSMMSCAWLFGQLWYFLDVNENMAGVPCWTIDYWPYSTLGMLGIPPPGFYPFDCAAKTVAMSVEVRQLAWVTMATFLEKRRFRGFSQGG
jgi:hypothetical protein